MHDSRYEKECPKHGWYFDLDGCAGCEAAGGVPGPIGIARAFVRAALSLFKASDEKRHREMMEQLRRLRDRRGK